MRRLMWFASGFAAACGLGICIITSKLFLPLIIVAAIGSVGACLALKNWKPARCGAVLLFGCTIGLVWFWAFRNVYLLPAISLDGSIHEVSAIAKDYSYETPYGSSVLGTMELDGKEYQIKLYVNDDMKICPGDSLRGKFELRYTAPGGKEEPTFHSGKGIFLLGYQRGEVEYIEQPPENDRLYAAEIAFGIKRILRNIFSADSFPFVQALLLGDTSELGYSVDTAFKISGIRHIVAVSGLHVTILYGLIHNLTFRRRLLSGLITLPLLCVFAAVAGFTPSVTRACIMIGLMILSRIFDREYDSPTALAFASAVMLAVNPLVISSVGFQMSVGCVAGILLFQERVSSWMKHLIGNPKGKSIGARLKRWLISSVSLTVGAMSITTPLSAYYFGTVSIIGIVTNLVTLWVINLIFNGLVASCLFCYIYAPLSVLLGKLLEYPIRYVLYISDLLSHIPMAAVYTESVYIVAWLVFVYVLLTVFLLDKGKKPYIFIACVVLSLCFTQSLSQTEPVTDDVRMTVLNVGQGQSIILQSDGKTFLIDCGGENDEDTADLIAETLLSQGIYHLDGIILTHTDKDHSGALSYVLSRVGTDRIYIPIVLDAETEFQLDSGLEGKTFWVKDTISISYENSEITIFGPSFLANRNENSLCILFTRENCDILITGDRGFPGEVMLMEQAQLPQVDVLIAGHHGSKDSTSEELLNTVRPEVAIISVGTDNPYGHPAQETLNRLYNFGCRVYRTDEQGTIIFRR